jgi:hypothetical protein
MARQPGDGHHIAIIAGSLSTLGENVITFPLEFVKVGCAGGWTSEGTRAGSRCSLRAACTAQPPCGCAMN